MKSKGTDYIGKYLKVDEHGVRSSERGKRKEKGWAQKGTGVTLILDIATFALNGVASTCTPNRTV